MQQESNALRLLHALGLAVVSTDRDGRVGLVNDAAAALFARPADQLSGARLLDLLAVADPDLDEPLDLAAVLAGGSWSGDLLAPRPEGPPALVHVTATPVRAPAPPDRPVAAREVVGAIVGLDDITELRRAEAEAAEGEQRLRLAHAAAQLGTWHWNAADGTNVWDAQMHRIYGLEPGGFDGTWDAWVASIHPEDRETALGVVAEALEARSSYVLRNRIVRPDGRTAWIEAHGRVLVGPQGEPAGTIGCVRDATDRVRMEQRQRDAAARAELLQEVTADFSRTATAAEVAQVLARSIDRAQAVVGADVVLAVPADLDPSDTTGAALVATGQTGLAPEDRQLLATLAAQHAIAAERASLLERTVALTEELQTGLAASPLPRSSHVEVAASYAPGGDALEHVGGDWYDVVAVDGERLAVVVGDVMGRGVRAATTMIHVRAGLRGLVTVQPDPAALLEAADRLLARDAPEHFVTAAAALLDPLAGTAAVASAGHVPAVLVDPDGAVTVLDGGGGLPLGLEPDRPRTAPSLPVRPGSLLVLVTDGVVESRDDDVDAGIERVGSTAARLRDRPLDEVVRAVAGLADDRLLDDVTVVAVRVR